MSDLQHSGRNMRLYQKEVEFLFYLLLHHETALVGSNSIQKKLKLSLVAFHPKTNI